MLGTSRIIGYSAVVNQAVTLAADLTLNIYSNNSITEGPGGTCNL